MKPVEFKNKWLTDNSSDWIEFDSKELDKSPLKEETKEFLKNGFPRSAAPFLDFGWISYDMKFYNLYDYYAQYQVKLEENTKNYWIFGSDNGGNPICFDTLNNDRLLLLDHEIGFEIIEEINVSVFELANCLLYYKEFINRVQTELGEDAFMNEEYTPRQIDDLREQFLTINPLIFKQSDFWNCAVLRLKN